MTNPAPTLTQSSNKVNVQNNYVITFNPKNNIPSGGYIKVFLPLTVSFPAELTVAVDVAGTSYTSPSVLKNIDFKTLRIGDIFPSAFTAVQASKAITVTINNIQNPQSIGSSAFLKILTTTENENLIDSANQTLRIRTNEPGYINSELDTDDFPASSVVSTQTSLFFQTRVGVRLPSRWCATDNSAK